MIRLDLKREPYWLDLGYDVRLQVRPATTALVMAARVAAIKEMQDTDDIGIRSAALIKNLAQLAVIGWEGIGDADGNPADLSSDGIAALMDLWPIANTFERQYLNPALLLEQEKNA